MMPSHIYMLVRLGMIGLCEEGWEEDVRGLKAQCAGGQGPVNDYEDKWRNTS